MYTLTLPDSTRVKLYGQFDSLGSAQEYLKANGYRENKAVNEKNVWDGYVRVQIIQILSLEDLPAPGNAN